MDIGTAKATAEEWSRVPHHLIDVVVPDEMISPPPISYGLGGEAIREIIGKGLVGRWWSEEPAFISAP